MVQLQLNPRRVLVTLLSILGVLFVLHVVVVTYWQMTGDEYGFGAVPYLNMDLERNLPTWFSTMILMCSSALLALTAWISSAKQLPWRGWMGLACIFLFMSIDEFTSIHEQLIEPLRHKFDATGALFFTWVVPYAVIALIIGLVYLRFLVRLPARTRVLMILSGIIYIGGAMGMEMVSGIFATPGGLGSSRPLFYVMLTIEETLEMIGIILFIYTLTDHLSRQHPDLALSVGPSDKNTHY